MVALTLQSIKKRIFLLFAPGYFVPAAATRALRCRLRIRASIFFRCLVFAVVIAFFELHPLQGRL